MNQLSLKPIKELLSYSFNIPAYQRGYRWKAANQVKELLEDVWSYQVDNSDAAAFYCLQPVVVKSVGETQFELIDGQQRLTTILLILHYFNETEFKTAKPIYAINFETRFAQQQFLNIVSDTKHCEQNIDLFHLNQAYSYIANYFTERESTHPNIRWDFYSKLTKSVKVIWYSIGDSEENANSVFDIFIRLNIGKIPLTNAELIKALFLSKSGSNLDLENQQLVQYRIASEWDEIEKTLQEEAFWHFICNQSNQYETRIEYIFDLVKEKRKDDEVYFTFHKFLDDFEQPEDKEGTIEVIWKEIKDYFLTFEEWYTQKEYFHLIGYLVSVGQKVPALKKASKGKTKTAFKKWLRQEALKTLRIDIDELNYQDHKHKKYIRHTLLLFNILSILKNPTSSIRFPFHFFHGQKWDIEHIRSQTPKDISGKDKRNWATTHLYYFTGYDWDVKLGKGIDKAMFPLDEEEKNICQQLLQIIKQPDQEQLFTEVYEKLKQLLGPEEKKFKYQDSIANLTLLDQTTNRTYKNAFFPVKRKYIIEKETAGTFVPLCTQNVFLKAYSNSIKNFMYWNEEDAKDYLNAIKSILNHE